ncbi:hypothetical protein CHT99_07120 [Sphingobacterium cellulitidis]|nr:hypothetical protein CHT99_07120 [Sphingobacterium cellulitidis]
MLSKRNAFYLKLTFINSKFSIKSPFQFNKRRLLSKYFILNVRPKFHINPKKKKYIIVFR